MFNIECIKKIVFIIRISINFLILMNFINFYQYFMNIRFINYLIVDKYFICNLL